MTAQLVKKKLFYFMVPDVKQWRMLQLQEVLKLRQGHLKIYNLDSQEISAIIAHICTRSMGLIWWSGFPTEHPSFTFPQSHIPLWPVYEIKLNKLIYFWRSKLKEMTFVFDKGP